MQEAITSQLEYVPTPKPTVQSIHHSQQSVFCRHSHSHEMHLRRLMLDTVHYLERCHLISCKVCVSQMETLLESFVECPGCWHDASFEEKQKERRQPL